MKDYVVPDPNETKFERFKRETKEKIDGAVEWAVNNPEKFAILTTVVTSGVALAGKLVKGAGRRANLKKEEAIKNLYCYDRSLGHYWKLRRELTNDEWLMIDARKKAGERLSDILDELKVLK